MEKFARNIGIGIIVLLLQFTLGNWIELSGVKPDLVLLYIIYLGYSEGKISGIMYGFLLGMLQDLAAASTFIGLSALIKSIVGFSAGFLYGKYHILNPIWLAVTVILIIFFGQMLYFVIYYAMTPLAFQVMVQKFVVPTAGYTVVIGGLLFLIIPIPLRVD